MTRLFAWLTCLILVLGLCIGVSAADTTRARSVNYFATVSSDGSCTVTSTVTLHVDAPQSKLTYPIPLEASNVTLNGSPVLTRKTAQARLVDLHKILGGLSGDFSFTVGYNIPATVHTVLTESTKDEETEVLRRLRVELPMLAGFPYPIDDLQFSINLPGVISQKPSFISGYHQANIEKDLTYSISGGNIAGSSQMALKDHETLAMYLFASEEMFPQSRVVLPSVETMQTLITVLAVVALLYWLVFARNFLPLRSYPPVPPEGFGAGQLGSVLTRSGADLSLMAFSWAQLGYVTLIMDRRSRVLIQKRMEMGNERTLFERKCFQHLFARRDIVDTSTSFFHRLHQTVGIQRSAAQLFRHKKPTHVKVFRIITAAAGLLSGAAFGIILGNMLDYGWFFVILLGLVGLLCSWNIQMWPMGVWLHHRSRLWIALIAAILWLILGLCIQQFSLALAAVALQAAAGLLAAWGGRRTEDGQTAMGQTLSLYRYFGKLSAARAQALCQENPEAFFDLAPYALALGRSNILARRFGKSRLPACPYIKATDTQGLTAQQWSRLMGHILESMTTRQRKLPFHDWRSVLDSFMK